MASNHSPRFLTAVEDAKTRIAEISAEKVQQARENDSPYVLIDVREDREFAVDRCAGAVHLGKGVLERDVEGAFPNTGQTLVLYCGGGFRSALAADSLRAMGYTDARSMGGGIRAWRTLGYPLDTRE